MHIFKSASKFDSFSFRVGLSINSGCSNAVFSAVSSCFTALLMALLNIVCSSSMLTIGASTPLYLNNGVSSSIPFLAV
ncbi:hypothetical protein [Flavobacterium poyangense]|uniref:hypothetical protein n=1 Tax=Flavobacterium poyangense TaxID=2204302 RepID=UPI00141E3F8A|nr:hypothetical protein [Flavobacterium sp. JXAS1]